MPDMQGKTVVVTGGNSGIGFETAAALAAMGARVLVTARNADKGRAAVSAITQRLEGEGSGPARRLRPGRPGLGAAGRGRDPRPGAAPRRPRQQCGPGPDRARRDGRRVRGDVCHEPSRPVPADQSAARADCGIGAVPSGQRGLDGARLGPQGDPVRRPAVDAALPGHAGVRRVEAGQHLVHAGAGPAPRGQRGHGELPASRARCAPATGETGTPGAFWASGSRSPARSSCRRRREPAPPCTWRRPPRWRGSAAQYFVKCKPKQPRRWAQDAEAARRLWQVSEELVGLAPAGRA